MHFHLSAYNSATGANCELCSVISTARIKCYLSHSRLDCCNLVFGKSFEVRDESLACILTCRLCAPWWRHPKPKQGADAVVDVILPELHQCFLSISLSCSNSLGKGAQLVDLKSCCNSLVHWYLEGETPLLTLEWRTSINKGCRSITNNKQNLENYYVILYSILLA